MADSNPLPRKDENAGQADRTGSNQQQQVTHNLDTGRDEPLTPSAPEEESTMDFAPGSGGGSAGDGAGA